MFNMDTKPVDTLEKGSSFEINRAISYLLAICFIKISQMLSSKKGRKPAMCCLKWSVPSFWSFQKWTLCQGRFQSPRHPQKMTKGTKRPIGIIMVGFLKGWWSCRLLFCFFLRFRFFNTASLFWGVVEVLSFCRGVSGCCFCSFCWRWNFKQCLEYNEYNQCC